MGQTKRLFQCLACGGDSLTRVLDLGNQPLANSFKLTKDEYVPYSCLAVSLCEDCTHCQLAEAVDPDLLYKDYAYVSGTTDTLKNHFKDLVDSVLYSMPRSYDNAGHRFKVLDIGCNDCSLLEKFKEAGCEVYGVDPAENIAELNKHKGIPVLVDYWNSSTAFDLGGSFDIICALNCLAHNSNPLDFLKGCARVLKPEGKVLIEFPLFTESVDRLDLGQIYAEHHSYFSVRSMMTLTERAGFYIDNLTYFPKIHGGTFRFVLNRGLSSHCEKALSFTARMEKNHKQKVKEMQPYLSKLVMQLDSKLSQLVSEGYEIIAYGASAKSSTLFNLPNFNSSNISFVVDDNPLKQNKFCPGSDLLIAPPAELEFYKNNKIAVLLTVHNFKQEVIQRLRNLGLSGKLLINYVPAVSEETI